MSRYPTSWLVSLAVVALVLTGALWWVGSSDRSTPDAVPAVPATSPFSSVAGVTASAPALDVLHRWDRARARAYASGDVAGLRALYVDGSSAGTTDVRMLSSYLRRGLRVAGMRMQVLDVTVLAHAPGRWRLRVTDRLTGAVAVGRGTRVELPRDEASTRTLTLRGSAAGDDWVVATVRR